MNTKTAAGKANAKLFLAAPTMLAACKAALTFVVRHYRNDDGVNLRAELEAVIAEAETPPLAQS